MYAAVRDERHPGRLVVGRPRASLGEIVTASQPRLLLVVADGVRPDVLQAEIDAGRAPAMAALRTRGGMHCVTSSFPSVTGPAYIPFLMGRHPGAVGLPGLRWFDRARTLRWSPASARSYAGMDIWHLDHDVARESPTLFELARPSLSGMSMLGRGATAGNIGRSPLWSVRAAIPHFRGDIHGWRTVERAATAAFLRKFAAARPLFSILAITSPDKYSHKFGGDSEPVREAIADIDQAIANATAIAREGGWAESLRIWVVSDHGHAPVSQHDDLQGWLESRSLRVLAHPRLHTRRPDVALMVGGNAMAHLYLDPASRTRNWWPAHAPRWESLHDALLTRAAVDLIAVATSPTAVRVSHATRGCAMIRVVPNANAARFAYDAGDGDPLQLGGSFDALDDRDAWTLCAHSRYPDAIVQLLALCTAPRAGDLVLSAAEGWDLRSRYEPVAHVSTHGALLRDQMLVPLLLDGPVTRTPQRTADVMPSVLQALGLPVPPGLDGHAFN